MQQYFSHVCNGTYVQADWRSSTYGRAPNAIDISQDYLTCPYYTDTRPPFISAAEPKAQVHYCDHALSVVRPSVVNFSHFRLLWNRWTEFNETWQEARSQRPLPSLCFSGRSENKMAALASD